MGGRREERKERKKERKVLMPIFKYGEGVCHPHPKFKMVQWERSLIAEGYASHSTFINSRNLEQACILGP